MIKHMYVYIIFFMLLSYLSAGETYIHHELKLSVKPSKQYIEVQDRIEFPSHLIPRDVYFLLHSNMNVSASSADLKIQLVDQEPKAELFGIGNGKFEKPEKITYKLYKISVREESKEPQKISLTYKGIIHHPVERLSKEYARGFSETPGINSDEGVMDLSIGLDNVYKIAHDIKWGIKPADNTLALRGEFKTANATSSTSRSSSTSTTSSNTPSSIS